ncbi:MAG: DUF996 domain-containing protein [Candidatus Caldarchaeum sp.]|nr:DUF996 domain-containing protein [Candidatus Caldarchaeum sp.]
MAEISQARLIGGIGSILLLLGIVPSVGPVLGIVGLILLLLALRYVSTAVQQPPIFQNALYAVIIGIIGTVVALALGGATLFGALGGGFMGPVGDELAPDLFALFAGILVAVLVAWIFGVASSFFLRRAFNLTGDALGIKLFKTAGLLVFLGAILTIILVGAIITLVAYVLLAVAFFQIPAEGRQPPPPPPPP